MLRDVLRGVLRDGLRGVLRAVLRADRRNDFSARGARLREGLQEVLLTVLATLAFGLTWAAIEAGQANADLARAAGPGAWAEARATGPEAAGRFATGYVPARLETR